MAFKVIALDIADEDLQDAIDWYKEQKPLLGSKFYNEFLICLHKLSESPQNYGCVYKEFRQIVLSTFLYKIIYLITGNEVITHAVFQQRRSPKQLIKRLK